MKSLLLVSPFVISFAFAPLLLRAQDAPPPPPPDQMQGGAPDQGGDQDASYQTFYDQLGSDGTGNWVQTDQYGYVFQPNVQDPNWAPYTVGSWAYSDAGWTWVSDEPWGWATYHYGRWVNIDGIGWVWVPGTRWAPAWVSWRSGGGYYGWAPLPPDADEGDADFHFGDDADVSFDIGPGCYNFIPYADFGAPNCSVYIVDRYRNYGIVGHTRNITNFNLGVRGRGFGGAFAGGPALAQVNARSSRHVPTVRLAAANQVGPAGLHGNQLSVFAPRINPSTAHTGRPASVSRTVSAATVNHGASIRDPLVVNSRVKPRAPTATELQQAASVQKHASTAAHVGGVNHPETTVNTGESANTGEAVHHTTTTSSTFHPEAANTGEAVQHTTSTSPSSFHAEEQPRAAAPPEEHHTEEHNAPAPQVQHFNSPPAEEHHAEEHNAPAPQVQRSAPAPQAQQHSAPAQAPHPSGGGGGGGKPAPGNNNNQQH